MHIPSQHPTKMNKNSQRLHDEQVAEVYHMGGITQKELGVYLGRSQSAILKAIQRAAKAKTTPTPPPEK
jgi:DNA-binding transcriptional regulator LsrR (DeoR family)